MWVLKAAARRVLRRMDPDGRGYVTEGDLISEGWARSVRYGCDGTMGKQLIWCVKHMMTAWRELSFEQAYTPCRPQITHLSDDYPLERPDGQDGPRCVDLWDLIEAKCSRRQRQVLERRFAGETLREVGQQLGVTHQSVSLTQRRAVAALRRGEG
ncbi:MAG: hypothetical protein JW993_10795 [Sedimentisphaerales bacterium]|nr:hypothetical protein [Sedimentisphaerales bacterium]